jgi:hypothetical protein
MPYYLRLFFWLLCVFLYVRLLLQKITKDGVRLYKGRGYGVWMQLKKQSRFFNFIKFNQKLSFAMKT